MFFYIYISIIMFYVIPFIIYYFSFHVSYIYICILQNKDGKDNKKKYVYIFILIYFLYVEIKYVNQNFIK